MKIDAYIIATIKENLKLSGLSKSEFAKKIGKANSWVTKLLSGQLQTLDDETSMRIQQVLDFDFFMSDTEGSTFSQKVKRLSQDEKFQDILIQLIDLREKNMNSSDREEEAFFKSRMKSFLRFSEDAEFAIKGAKIVRQTCEEVEDRYLCLYLINRMEEYMGFNDAHRAKLKTPSKKPDSQFEI